VTRPLAARLTGLKPRAADARTAAYSLSVPAGLRRSLKKKRFRR
jgi:hypothetical protein